MSANNGLSGPWPEGKRSAVLVTVNVDATRAILTERPDFEGHVKTLSTSVYGMKHGIAHIVDCLADVSMRASWFLPGRVAEEFPDTVRQLSGLGHDLGVRGWDLERFDELTAPDVADRLGRSLAAFAAADATPTGFRMPRGDWPLGLVDALASHGLTWSSSWVAEDLPFRIAGSDGAEVIELPFHWVMNDRQAFAWNFAPAVPAGHSRIASYADVLESWTMEFDATRDEGLLWVLSLHPEVIGTPGRLGILRDMLAHVRADPTVWVATGAEIAQWWRESAPPNPSSHPAEVFLRERGLPHY